MTAQRGTFPGNRSDQQPAVMSWRQAQARLAAERRTARSRRRKGVPDGLPVLRLGSGRSEGDEGHV